MGKALQSLMKYGNELYLEADEKGLSLRTFNSNKSAMVNYVFNRIYFQTFELTPLPQLTDVSGKNGANRIRNFNHNNNDRSSDIDDEDDEDCQSGLNCCKVSMRALQSAFKPPKQVERCEMCLLSDVGKLQFRFQCKSDLVKNTVITILSNENISAKIDQSQSNSSYV